MEWLVSNFGGVFYYTDLKHDGWKNRYNWRPTGLKNKDILLLGILPYLILKREQAILALSYIRLNGRGTKEQYVSLAERCSFLNQKGRSVETNTSDTSTVKIESELVGDNKSELAVTQVS